MTMAAVFTTTTSVDRPMDGNLTATPAASTSTRNVSDFITIQSFTNFAAMTGAIAAAWGGAKQIGPLFASPWFPAALCLLFGLASVVTSGSREVRVLLPAILIALVNSLVLFGAVISASSAVVAT